jgi:hypothetical protein
MADLYTVTSLDSAVYTNTANWIGGSAPTANDTIFLQFDSETDMAGSDQSATELDDIYVTRDCTGTIGTPAAYLQLDQGTTNSLFYEGQGTAYIDLGTSGSALVRVDDTRTATTGTAGLYFKNDTNAITLMEVNGGTVRLVDANITTLVVRNNATVIIDAACTIGTIDCDNGNITDYGCALTTWNHNGGTGVKYGSDAYAVNVYGGTFYNDGTGTATAVVYEGLFNSDRDSRSKSLTLTQNGGQVTVGPNVTLSGTFNTGIVITT